MGSPFLQLLVDSRGAPGAGVVAMIKIGKGLASNN